MKGAPVATIRRGEIAGWVRRCGLRLIGLVISGPAWARSDGVPYPSQALRAASTPAPAGVGWPEARSTASRAPSVISTLCFMAL